MRYIALCLIPSLFLFSGCVSAPPSKYYTLDMTPSGQVKPAINLEIETIEVAEALQRESILIMASPTTVEYYASEQWVAGLHELVRQKLESELGAKHEGLPTYGMLATVRSFGQIDAPDGTQAQASLGIEIRPLHESRYNEPLFEKIYSVTKPVQDPSVDNIVIALSHCLEEIALEIASDTQNLKEHQNTIQQ